MEDLASYGVYGGSAIASFVFGIVPFNADVVLFGISASLVESPAQLPLMTLIAAAAHTLAKIVTYYMGIGMLALPARRPRLKRLMDRGQARLDKWNRLPKTTIFASAVIGLPPLILVGFIASAMRVKIVPFMVLVFVGRILHFGAVVVIPWIDFARAWSAFHRVW